MTATLSAAESETTLEHRPQVDRAIVFFDGECTMCNAAVDVLMRRSSDELLLAPLQGETAQTLLSDAERDLSSMVYRSADGQVLRHSSATFAAWSHMTLPFRLAGKLGLLVPRFLRDPVYKFIAANRYRWFGKKETCRVPTDEERSRILP